MSDNISVFFKLVYSRVCFMKAAAKCDRLNFNHYKITH